MNNQITVPELRVIDENSANLGVLKREEALRLAKEKGLDLIEIAPTAKPPVAHIISFDKFRYQKEKEEKKQRQAQKTKELKHIRISPRAALNDLRIKANQTESFLEYGHQVEILLFVRGREKGNRDWNLKKLNGFLNMIKIPHLINLEPRFVGKGFIVHIAKK
ncbi:MAG: translation initiation factor IF-3 [Patescibacteria group bacterium]|nr:translation initiation factor IF-3 [Patescibacteria group bacterium]